MISLPTFRGVLSSFSPLSLAPALWVTDTGSDPSVWTDMSGNGRHAVQATGANQPSIVTNVINGRQVRRFNATSTFLVPPNFSLDNFTVFSAIYPKNTSPEPAYKTIFSIGSTSASSARDVLFNTSNVSGVTTLDVQRSNGSTFPTAKVTTSNLSFQIASGKFTGTELIAYVNNGTRNTVATTITGTSDNLPAIGAVKQFGGTGFFYEGDIAEIIVYPTNLSDFNCLRVERYLSKKYNITIA